MIEPTLSDSQSRQLIMLKLVYDNPTITGFWKGDDCDALVELGYADRHEVNGIQIVSITPSGIEEANRRVRF